MQITQNEYPRLWESLPFSQRVEKLEIDDKLYGEFRREADETMGSLVPSLCDFNTGKELRYATKQEIIIAEKANGRPIIVEGQPCVLRNIDKEVWALYNAYMHPGFSQTAQMVKMPTVVRMTIEHRIPALEVFVELFKPRASYYKKALMAVLWLILGALLVLLSGVKLHAQNTFIRGTAFGPTTATTITGTANCLTNHNCFDVAVLNTAHIICDSGCVSGGSSGTSSSFGAAFPATGTAIGVSDGTNMVAVRLGQALAAASIPVILPSATVTALTPPTAAAIASAIVSNPPTVPVTGPLTDTQLRASPVPISGTVTITDGSGAVNVIVDSSALPAGASTLAEQQTQTTSLGTLAGAVSSSVVQSNTKQVNGVTTLAGAGAVGTGSQRVAVGQDATTIAGSAPGTAGSASINVVTVQGIASGTPQGVSVASGGIASGAIASGAIASGACASGCIADGGLVTLGAKADAKSTATDTTAITVMQVLKEISAMEQAPAALPANQSTNTSQVNAHTLIEAGVNGAAAVGGCVATNVATPCNPMNLGAQAVTSENSAATTAREVQLVADKVGKLIVMPYANPENFVSGVITSAMTGTTSTSLVAAPAGSLRNYITQITCSNAHATVGTDIIVQDGNGGTTIYILPAAAVYGGAALSFPVPLKQPTAATALYVANVTTGASTKCAASGYTGL